MQIELSPKQREKKAGFRSFVREHISPHAAEWDRREAISSEISQQLRSHGYLGCFVSGIRGEPIDAITYGILTEEIAHECSSVRSLITVQDMVALGISRWGSSELKG